MNLVANVLAVVLILVCVLSAIMDFKKDPKIVESMRHLRVPENAIPALGAVKLVAAAGLLVGFQSTALAKAAGIGLCVYFAVATATHTRVKDGIVKTLPAFVLTVLSVLFVLVTFAK